MKILINDCDVDIQLEKENSCREVGESIAEWAKERNLIFVEVEIDGKVFSPAEIPELALDDVELFNCIIQSKADLILTSITEGISYCDRVHKYIHNSLEEEKFEVEELEPFYVGMQWLSEMTRSVFQLIELDLNEVKYLDHPVVDYLEQITGMEKDLSKLTDEKSVLNYFGKNRDFFDLYKGIFKMLLLSDKIKTLIIQSVDSPDVIFETINKVRAELPAQLDNLAGAAISFQEGKDSEGSEKLQAFIDFVYLFVRVSYQISPIFKVDLSEIVVDEISYEEKNSEIQQLLSEIVEVMENSDIISLADILEYEMKPVMENISEYLDIVLEKIA